MTETDTRVGLTDADQPVWAEDLKRWVEPEDLALIRQLNEQLQVAQGLIGILVSAAGGQVVITRAQIKEMPSHAQVAIEDDRMQDVVIFKILPPQVET